ncbi:MAG: 2-oxoglutarate dehydrogenase E1 subunit family protein, partial [Ilumatobacteraceae bacterium]
MTATSSTGPAFGTNSWLVEEMYEQFRDDPQSVGEAWREFFADYRSSTPGYEAPPTVVDEEGLDDPEEQFGTPSPRQTPEPQPAPSPPPTAAKPAAAKPPPTKPAAAAATAAEPAGTPIRGVAATIAANMARSLT